MADPNASHADATSGAHGHSHVGRYAVVWGALLAFTFLTYGLSRLHIPGGWGVVVALTIAAAKGTLVALFFMHLWDQSGPTRLRGRAAGRGRGRAAVARARRASLSRSPASCAGATGRRGPARRRPGPP